MRREVRRQVVRSRIGGIRRMARPGSDRNILGRMHDGKDVPWTSFRTIHWVVHHDSGLCSMPRRTTACFMRMFGEMSSKITVIMTDNPSFDPQQSATSGKDFWRHGCRQRKSFTINRLRHGKNFQHPGIIAADLGVGRHRRDPACPGRGVLNWPDGGLWWPTLRAR